MTRLLPITLLAFSACVYGPTVPERSLAVGESAAVAETLEAWRAADLDAIGEECDDAIGSLTVSIARSHDEMFAATGYCGPSPGERRNGCPWGRAAATLVRVRDGGVWPFALAHERRYTVVVFEGVDAVAAVRHEAVHLLQRCTGRGYDPRRPHSDAVVWCADGCPGEWR